MTGELIPRITVRDHEDRELLAVVLSRFAMVSGALALSCPCGKGDECGCLLQAKQALSLVEALEDDEVASTPVPDSPESLTP